MSSTPERASIELKPQLLKDLAAGNSDSNPDNLTEVNGTLYFSINGFDGTKQTWTPQLWKSNGTASNTQKVKDFGMTDFSSSGIENLTDVNGTLYFTANPYSSGSVSNELWISNGQTTGTQKLKDFGMSDLSNLTDVNGKLFFTTQASGVRTATLNYELWQSNGTGTNTQKVKDLGNISPNLSEVKGSLYFTTAEFDKKTSAYDIDLWKSTTSGSQKVKDLGIGMAYDFTEVNGTLYFRFCDYSEDDSTLTYEIWKSNGTAAGTQKVKDLNTDFPSNFVDVNGTLYFTVSANENNSTTYELWKSNGTASGTEKLKNLGSFENNLGSPYELIDGDGTLYFTLQEFDSQTSRFNYELWKSNGTGATTQKIKDLGSAVPDLVEVNGAVYFSAVDEQSGAELWTTDGTASGTVLVADLYPGQPGSFPQNLANINDTLYFTADNGKSGNELWKLSETQSGTSGADILIGTSEPDEMNGLEGNDTLSGLNGKDILIGSAGVDQLDGGSGNDTLTGGTEGDRFIYNTNAAFRRRGIGVDTITDFIADQGDKIVLDKTTFTKLNSTAGEGFSRSKEFAIVNTNTQAARSPAEIVYNSSTGALFYNPNGSKLGFGIGGHFLTLTGTPELQRSSFLIQE